MHTKVVILILFFALHINNSQEIENGLDQCDPLKLTCICGVGAMKKHKLVQLEGYFMDNLEIGKKQCIYPDRYETCADTILENGPCYYAPNKSYENGKDLNYNGYPKVFIIPRDSSEKTIAKRDYHPCMVTQLKNADVKCWKFRDYTSCSVNCIPEHHMEIPGVGNRTSVTDLLCNWIGGEWEPHGMYDCKRDKPLRMLTLSCKAQLVKPGYVKCAVPDEGPSHCDISCFDYASFTYSPFETHLCINNTFSSLPFCAATRTYGVIQDDANEEDSSENDLSEDTTGSDLTDGNLI